jgi:hypothetical protein
VERRKEGKRVDSRLRVIGFVLGIGVAASIVAAQRIPAGAGVLGADVHLVVAPIGELAVKPSGIVLTGTGLTPASDPVTGSVQVLNQTGSVLDVHVRGVPDTHGLDRTLWIAVTGPDDEEIYRGALGGFRNWSSVGVTMRPGRWSTFSFEAWVPGDVGPGYAGRIAQVDLGFIVRTEKGS